ncbi:MAG: AAA family ATPase [Desulfobacteraceae bacterium]|nr:AAA family ATPase [Desulfobacteraceae bacterium]
MQNDTNILFKTGFFSYLDYYFADTLLTIAKENNQIVKLSAALVSKTSRDGHICIDISQMANESIDTNDPSYPEKTIKYNLPGKKEWIEALKSSRIVGEDCNCPLVLDSDNKLYLARYFDYQKRIIKNISQRIRNKPANINMSALDTELNKYFKAIKTYSHEKNQGISIQKQAVQKAILNNFLIISGGPGTGKTHITDKIAKTFVNLSDSTTPAKIVNTAPTGKAASKLKAGLTIHRLLQIKTSAGITTKKTKVRVAADLVIIDEASMIDISLMAKLVEAIPLDSKVIIIGDQNQLGSIETGSVFADICLSKQLSSLIVNLEYNFRSGGKKEIDKLAKAINSGDQTLIENILTNAQDNNTRSDNIGDLSFISINDPSEITSKLKDLILKEYTPYIKENDLSLAYKELDRFKILCSHRKNFFGADSINIFTEKLLQDYRIHDIKHPLLKSILMITKNDYNKLLFNGDIGMIIEKDGTKEAVFMNEDSTLRSFKLSELKTFEQAYAITVHKSQGSEFDHVLFILPPAASTLLTKELLYTAITRARKKVTIAGDIDVIKKVVGSYSKKESGLTKMLDKTLLGQ